jgi:hypothetical protein
MPVFLKRLMDFLCKRLLRCYFLCLDTKFICSFLLLAQKKRTKEKGSLKSFLGLTFWRLPTQYNSLSAFRRIAQTVLLTYGHSLRSLQNVTLFPKKIWRHCSPCGDMVLIGTIYIYTEINREFILVTDN